MDDQRTTPVNDTRFALTVLICLLVAVGYLVLVRIGSPGKTTIEQRGEVVLQLPVEPSSDDDPQVVPVDDPAIANRIPTSPETRK